MLALARVADRGPVAAALLSAGLLLAVVLVPVLMLSTGSGGLVLLSALFATACLIASAAVVAFVALRHGEMSALQVAGGCLLLLAVLSLLIIGTAFFMPMLALTYWLPAIVGALVLARSVRLEYAVLALVFCGALAFIVFSLAVGDPIVYWESRLANVYADTAAVEGASATPVFTEEQLSEITTTFAKLLAWNTGVFVMTMGLAALFLARSWQAGLVNPGGFQKEFHGLSLGRNAALLCLMIIVLSTFIGGGGTIAIALVVLYAFSLQGLAVVHALVKQRGMHRFWLHGIYVLMVLPQTLLLLAALGLADNMFSLRRPEKEQ